MSKYLHLRRLGTAQGAATRARRPSVPALLLLGALSSVVAAFGLPMGAASAARTAPRSVAQISRIAAVAAMPRTSTFCAFAQAAAANSNASSAANLKAPSLQADYTKLKSEETTVLATSPSQLKGDFVALFAYVNKLYAELASVKFVYSKLPPSYYEALAKTNTKQIEADVKVIDAYLTNTCHVKA